MSIYLADPEKCYTIVSMPEFLAEGIAVKNLLKPDRVVVGTPPNKNGEDAFELLKALY